MPGLACTTGAGVQGDFWACCSPDNCVMGTLEPAAGRLRCPACGKYAAYLVFCWAFDSELCDDCRVTKTDRLLRGLA